MTCSLKLQVITNESINFSSSSLISELKTPKSMPSPWFSGENSNLKSATGGSVSSVSFSHGFSSRKLGAAGRTKPICGRYIPLL